MEQPRTSRVPQAEFEFRHKVAVQQRFTDFDMLGHVNNTAYLQYMDLAKSQYMEDVIPTGVDWRKINVAIVNINCNYYAQSFPGEEIEVRTAVAGVGEKSITIEQRVVGTAKEQVKCICRTIMAAFDLQTLQSVPVSAEWVAAFEAYEGRRLTR